ncbi:Peroxidase 1 [Triticum urartu]|uniref:Peroxidase 1 n=1 Tax=Triticum urartu TaxID=4572 RepID=M7YN12_TRIUA|nr:Peroxidase 1 [Triticum urartu]
MASSRSLSSRSGTMLAGALLLLLSTASAVAQLDVGFYSKTCPHVEEIVRQEMLGILKEAPTLAGPFLRLHFHDCFVRGCDASVLIDSTDVANSPAEKDAPPNKSLRGFGAVERCRSLADNTTLAEMDPGSFLTFDAGYYRLVAKRRGILHSDSALLEHPTTRAYVERQATGLFAAEFFRDFAESMVKMGNIGVLTGEQGEIRSKCYAVNK